LAILLRVSTVANADEQLRCFPKATKNTARAGGIGHPPGQVICANRLRLGSRCSRCCGFG
jgi:hypothetical protein